MLRIFGTLQENNLHPKRGGASLDAFALCCSIW
ncbi:UNVERIFIED_CONTAM: hypothetical protein C7454_12235 [Acidovorax defluvii]